MRRGSNHSLETASVSRHSMNFELKWQLMDEMTITGLENSQRLRWSTRTDWNLHWDRCNILICPHFSVHMRSVHKWNTLVLAWSCIDTKYGVKFRFRQNLKQVLDVYSYLTKFDKTSYLLMRLVTMNSLLSENCFSLGFLYHPYEIQISQQEIISYQIQRD